MALALSKWSEGPSRLGSIPACRFVIDDVNGRAANVLVFCDGDDSDLSIEFMDFRGADADPVVVSGADDLQEVLRDAGYPEVPDVERAIWQIQRSARLQHYGSTKNERFGV